MDRKFVSNGQAIISLMAVYERTGIEMMKNLVFANITAFAYAHDCTEAQWADLSEHAPDNVKPFIAALKNMAKEAKDMKLEDTET